MLMSKKTLILSVGGAGLLALGGALVALVVRAANDKPADAVPSGAVTKPALTVTATTPRSGRWPATVSANGNIAAWQEAIIGAEAQGLRLTEVRVQVGDRVKRGQLLALLSADTLAAEVAATRAGVAEAEADLAEAAANAERARQLQASGAIERAADHPVPDGRSAPPRRAPRRCRRKAACRRSASGADARRRARRRRDLGARRHRRRRGASRARSCSA